MLCAFRTVKLMQVVDVAGSELSDVAAVALLLGHKSICRMKTILEQWFSGGLSDPPGWGGGGS